jgi:hypothetical protein
MEISRKNQGNIGQQQFTLFLRLALLYGYHNLNPHRSTMAQAGVTNEEEKRIS